MPESDCPNLADHTDVPVGYLQKAHWAEERMAEGWTQRQCDGCGLWAIWLDADGHTMD